MNFLFITDPLGGFNLDKDSSLAMMRMAQARGHVVWACGTPELHWQSGQLVSASMQRLHLRNTPKTGMLPKKPEKKPCVKWTRC